MPTELYRHIGHKHIFIYVKASTYPLRVIPNAFRDEKLKKKKSRQSTKIKTKKPEATLFQYTPIFPAVF